MSSTSLALPPVDELAPVRVRVVSSRWIECANAQRAVLSYLARMMPSSRRVIMSALEQIAGLVGARASRVLWHKLNREHAIAIRATLAASDRTPATVNRMLSALRGVLREAFALGLMTYENFERVGMLEPVKGSRVSRGRELTSGELVALVRACDHGDDDRLTNAGARDAAMLGLLYGCGLRRAELAAVELADVDTGAGTTALECAVGACSTLLVHGKGNKDRRVPIPAGVGAALDAWIERRGRWPGPPLLLAIVKGDRMLAHGLSVSAIRDRLAELAHRARIARFSPHDLRRSYMTHLLRAGVDSMIVARLAGHASHTTTQRYDMRGEHDAREASDRLHFPFSERATR